MIARQSNNHLRCPATAARIRVSGVSPTSQGNSGRWDRSSSEEKEARFDARFFCVDSGAIIHRLENIIHPDAELVELTWLPIAAARRLDLPVITGLVLEELQALLRAGLRPDLRVPFYNTRNGDFTRDLID